ncbi:MFS transporter [Microbacterium sp. NPDC055910]|uniref:MFS transporter n=1 Tax=Microbacterium sp. NPDC055910 TaxID=3345659 RepID=UPI0035D63935
MRTGSDRSAAFGITFAALGAGIVSSLGILLVPSIAAAYDVEVATAQWMLTANLIAGVVATPILGRLSDGGRPRRVMMLAILSIGIGSVVCALAPNFAVFLLGRILQGPSYALFPVAAALARRSVSEPRVLRSALAGLAVSGAVGTGLGYPITGLLAEVGSFSTAFWFGAGYILLALVAVSPAIVPLRTVVEPVRHRFDYLGAVLLGGGLCGVLFYIAEGPTLGWLAPIGLVALAVGVLALACWVWQALRVPHPVIDLRGSLGAGVLLANLVTLVFGMTVYMVASGSGIVGQAPHSTGYGYAWTVAQAGWIMLPLTLGAYVSSIAVGKLSVRIGTEGRPVVWALAAGVAGAALASGLLVFAHGWSVTFYLGMLVAGLGMGIAYGVMPLLIGRHVKATDFGSAMSFNQLLRTVGGSVGAALSGAIIASYSQGQVFPDPAGVVLNFAVPGLAASALLGVLVIVALRRK